MSDDGGVVTRGPGERTTVPGLLLDVADDGTFGALSDGEDVANVQGGLLSAVDKRTGRETLGGDKSLLTDLVSVRVSEDDGGQGGTTKAFEACQRQTLRGCLPPTLTTHRPVSWMISLTIPRMYPFFSAKSKGLSLAGFFLLWVWALKIPPDLRWFLITRCGHAGSGPGRRSCHAKAVRRSRRDRGEQEEKKKEREEFPDL